MTTPPSGYPPDPGAAAAKKRETRDTVRIVAVILLVVVLVWFVLDNSKSVYVSFVFFHRSVPLIWVLIVTALFGAMIDRLLIWRTAKNKKAAAKAAQQP